MNEPIFGYILMENDNTYKEISNVERICDGDLHYVRFTSILQSLDCMNRNKREYNGDAIVASLSTPEITELISHNKFKGEAGHPVGMPIPRVSVVDPKFTCHRITKWWRDGNLIYGIVETLDDGMYGTKLYKAILQGEDPSFSYRGFATMVKKNGHDYVASQPRCIAYDEVNLPSHKEAYAVPGRTFIQQDMTGKQNTYVKESYQFDMNAAMEKTDSGIVIPITPKEVAEMVQEKSENLAIVCESFGLDPSTLAKVGKNSFQMKKDGCTYVARLESKIAKDVAYYFGDM